MAREPDSPDAGASESSGSTVLTPTALGKAWGTSRAYASKCIGKGCPTSSIEAANQWRQENSKYGIGYRSKHKAGADEAPPGKSNSHKNLPEQAVAAGAGTPGRQERERREEEPPGNGGGDGQGPVSGLGGLERSLRKAIAVEEEAARLVEEAQRHRKDETISIRIAAYTKAQKGRLDAEEQIVKLQEKIGLLISLDKAKAMIRRVFMPLLTRLRSLPKRAAYKANPVDDVHAEGVLKAEAEEIIAELRKQFADAAALESLRKDVEAAVPADSYEI